MLNLMDYIKNDLPTIEGYIGRYGVPLSKYVGSDAYFSNWASCKKKLFRLLGGKLIYEKEINIEKSEDLLWPEIVVLSDKYFQFFIEVKDYIKENYISKSIPEMCEIYDSHVGEYWDYTDSVTALFDRSCLVKNQMDMKTSFYNYKKKKTLKFDDKAKAVRTAGRVLSFYDMVNIPCKSYNGATFGEVFEQFRIAHSMVLNEKRFRGKLCFSIHPLDFMTMSDNGYKWSSCMNWKDGCYHAGTVEMMNSNNVICVYLKGQEPYTWEYKGEEYQWSNKKWRQLFYVTKDIIVGGKAYPFQSKEMTYIALEELRKLAADNWNHTYDFGIELYKDMAHIHGFFEMRNNYNWLHQKNTQKKNILFHSKGMYNDMINDHRTPYYCIRNKVKKNTIITYSGKCNCIRCNKDVLQRNYDIEDNYVEVEGSDEQLYNERYGNVGYVMCPDCLEDFCCDSCKEYNVNLYKFPSGQQICGDCLRMRDIFICPCCGKPALMGPTHMETEDPKLHKTIFIFPDVNESINHYHRLFKERKKEDASGICALYHWLDIDFIAEYRCQICKECRDHILEEEKNLPVERLKWLNWAPDNDILIYKMSLDKVKKYLKPGFKPDNLFYQEDQGDSVKEKFDVEQLRIY